MAPPPAGANGLLPVSVLHKNSPQKNPPAPPPRGPRAAQPRLKLICRRLPPGLTKAEFDAALGDAWKVGAGMVDWAKYRKGKISTDAAKPSKPARAYIHVTKQEHVKALGDHVRATTFHDATKSWQDPALVGPPTLEFAPYPKMPGGRRRHDNRQGTIDQDQEFKDFLEALTNPITRPAAPDPEANKEKVKTTPLIEALREKKANRDKPNTRGNRQNRGDAKDDNGDKKILSKSGKENALNSGDKNRRVGKGDKNQATKEAVKILNKEAAATKAAASAEKASAGPAPERKRGNVALAKSMLQRDLGVGPTPNRRRGTKREVSAVAGDAAGQAKAAPPVEGKAKDVPSTQPAAVSAPDKNKKERPTRAERRAFKAGTAEKPNSKGAADDGKVQTPTKAPAPQILKKPQTPVAPKGPAALRGPPPPSEPAAAKQSPGALPAKAAIAAGPASNLTPKALPPSPVPAPTSKQAFLKHANPSQGITEPLIEETMRAFGSVERVEIDKRKGFAYVDFSEPGGLQKAMAASPIKIAQGAVQVLERKEKVARAPRFPGPNAPPTGPARGGRGAFTPRGGRGGRGGARGGHVAPGSSPSGGDAAPVAPVPPPAPAAVVNVDAGS
ncbi:hypothetical protein ACN47E_007596 [Coniothyrium glycines]